MTSALIELQAAGYDEAVVREHSLAWITEALQAMERRRRHEQANLLAFEVMAAALGAGSKEAAQEIEATMERLLPPEEQEDLSHLLDPNAQTDWDALRAGGMLARVKVAVPMDSTVPAEEPDGERQDTATEGRDPRVGGTV